MSINYEVIWNMSEAYSNLILTVNIEILCLYFETQVHVSMPSLAKWN